MKGNLKLIGRHKGYEGEGLKRKEIIETTIVEKPTPCKHCGKNPRAPSSSRCKECSFGYKKNLIQTGRLAQKINKQLLNK